MIILHVDLAKITAQPLLCAQILSDEVVVRKSEFLQCREFVELQITDRWALGLGGGLHNRFFTMEIQ